MGKVWPNNWVLALALILAWSGDSFQVRAEYGELVGNWLVDYGQTELRLYSQDRIQLQLSIFNVNPLQVNADYQFVVSSQNAAKAEASLTIKLEEFQADGSWRGEIEVLGKRFGYSHLTVELHSSAGEFLELSPQELPVAVLRGHVVDERVTTYVSAALALLMFLNLGTVLDLQRLRGLVFRPLGPLVGICSRYVAMPALGFGLGQALWPQQPALQLALFYTALAPSGGLANVCVVFLKGNLNLSIATTTINSLLALAFLPLWILLLARVVFEDEELGVPFGELSVGAVALVVCLAVGLLLRLCVPKTTRFVFRFLKPLSVLLSLCLVGLTVGLNWFAFAEFSWQVLVAAVCLPLAGYLFTYLFSKIMCRSPTDALTLAIETSVLNMTMPIMLLQSSRLEQPQLDLILVVPIAASLVSLLLIVLLYVVRRCCGWNVRQDEDGYDHKQLLAGPSGMPYQHP